MPKQSSILVAGSVVEACGNSIFKVKLENGLDIIAHLSGKIRMHSIIILVGDDVQVEMSPYDLTKGRISRRMNSRPKSQ